MLLEQYSSISAIWNAPGDPEEKPTIVREWLRERGVYLAKTAEEKRIERNQYMRDRYARRKAEREARHPLQDLSDGMTGMVAGWIGG